MNQSQIDVQASVINEIEFIGILRNYCFSKGLSMHDFAISEEMRINYTFVEMMTVAGHITPQQMIDWFLITSQIKDQKANSE